MKTVIISLGGSIIVPDEINVYLLKEFRDIILEFINENKESKHNNKQENRVVIICGGGNTAKKYMDAVKKFGSIDNKELDWIGIKSTKLNAEFIRVIFGKHAFGVIDNPKNPITSDKKILIAAGYEPGCSTDMDAVLLAGTLEAKQVVNLSNIDYAYTKDPHLHKDALPIKETSWDKFFEIAGDTWSPRMNTPFDPVASRKAKELGLEVVILNGTKLDNFKNYLYDRDFVGTRIK